MDTPPAMSSPTKALNPLSPERMNQQSYPTSPSLSSDIRSFHTKGLRSGSDVQSRVAFLNTLSRGNSPAAGSNGASSGTTAALQRAILGREEAESALAAAEAKLADAQSRERRLTERLDSLMEDFHGTKERQAHERSVFEKEIRKARKEAFRAGSNVVKIQEELKHVRAEAKMLKDELQIERESKEKARQEAFERAYALAGLTEELEVLKGRLRSLEANSQSDNLEAQAQKMNREDIGRLSLAEGDLAMFLTPTPRRLKRHAEDSVNSPLSNPLDHTPSQTPPKRQRLSEITIRPEDEDKAVEFDAGHEDMIDELQSLLSHERRLRERAEDMVHFLQMECEFKRCACRFGEDAEHSHNHEDEPAAITNENEEQQTTENDESHVDSHVDSEHNEPQHPQPADTNTIPTSPAVHAEPEVKAEDNEKPAEPLITFSPETGTFRAFPSPIRDAMKKRQNSSFFQPLGPQILPRPDFQRTSVRFSAAGSENAVESESPAHTNTFSQSPMAAVAEARHLEQAEEDLNQDGRHSTTTVPLKDELRSSNQFSEIEGTTISREEALAQIRARRGRANSMKRSVSLSDSSMRSGGMGVTPVRSAKRIPGVENSVVRSHGDVNRSRRDMSAPVRMRR